MRAFRAAWLILAGLLLGPGGPVRAAPPLPLVHVAADAGADGPLVLILSGDGDWSAFIRDLAAAAAAAGSPVLGLEARSYFSEVRTPEETAAALAEAVRAELAAWHRDSLVVIGYSRGADVAPFVLNRWPVELRDRVRAAALIGLSEHASFEFHLDDLVRDVVRPTDLATRPEVEKLAGIPLTCVRGADERDSFCERPVDGMQVQTHAGGHRATSNDGSIALVLRAVGLAR